MLRRLSSSISDLFHSASSTSKSMRFSQVHIKCPTTEFMPQPLHNAIDSDDLVMAQNVLAKCPNAVNEEDEKGQTALHRAAERGGDNAEVIIDFLIESGADVNATDSDGSTAAHYAVRQRRPTSVVQRLLAAGADYLAVDRHGTTVFELICSVDDNFEIFGLALEFGVLRKFLRQVGATTPNGHSEDLDRLPIFLQNSPLEAAARRGDVKMCNALLCHRFPINAYTQNGSAAHAALIGDQMMNNDRRIHSDILRLLLFRGIRADLTNSEGRTIYDLIEDALHDNPLALETLDLLAIKEYSNNRIVFARVAPKGQLPTRIGRQTEQLKRQQDSNNNNNQIVSCETLTTVLANNYDLVWIIDEQFLSHCAAYVSKEDVGIHCIHFDSDGYSTAAYIPVESLEDIQVRALLPQSSSTSHYVEGEEGPLNAFFSTADGDSPTMSTVAASAATAERRRRRHGSRRDVTANDASSKRFEVPIVPDVPTTSNAMPDRVEDDYDSIYGTYEGVQSRYATLNRIKSSPTLRGKIHDDNSTYGNPDVLRRRLATASATVPKRNVWPFYEEACSEKNTVVDEHAEADCNDVHYESDRYYKQTSHVSLPSTACWDKNDSRQQSVSQQIKQHQFFCNNKQQQHYLPNSSFIGLDNNKTLNNYNVDYEKQQQQQHYHSSSGFATFNDSNVNNSDDVDNVVVVEQRIQAVPIRFPYATSADSTMRVAAMHCRKGGRPLVGGDSTMATSVHATMEASCGDNQVSGLAAMQTNFSSAIDLMMNDEYRLDYGQLMMRMNRNMKYQDESRSIRQRGSNDDCGDVEFSEGIQRDFSGSDSYTGEGGKKVMAGDQLVLGECPPNAVGLAVGNLEELSTVGEEGEVGDGDDGDDALIDRLPNSQPKVNHLHQTEDEVGSLTEEKRRRDVREASEMMNKANSNDYVDRKSKMLMNSAVIGGGAPPKIRPFPIQIAPPQMFTAGNRNSTGSTVSSQASSSGVESTKNGGGSLLSSPQLVNSNSLSSCASSSAVTTAASAATVAASNRQIYSNLDSPSSRISSASSSTSGCCVASSSTTGGAGSRCSTYYAADNNCYYENVGNGNSSIGSGGGFCCTICGGGASVSGVQCGCDADDTSTATMDTRRRKSGGLPASRVDVREMMRRGVSEPEILAEWLQRLGLSQYLCLFLAQGYDLASIARVTPEDLTALGISNPADRKRLITDIQRWRQLDTDTSETWLTACTNTDAGIRDWLFSIGLVQYVELFEAQGYTTINEIEKVVWEDLEDIGVTKLGHMKRICLAIKRLKQLRREENSGRVDTNSVDYCNSNYATLSRNNHNTANSRQLQQQTSRLSMPSAIVEQSAATVTGNSRQRPVVTVVATVPSPPLKHMEDGYGNSMTTVFKNDCFGVKAPPRLNLYRSSQILSECAEVLPKALSARQQPLDYGNGYGGMRTMDGSDAEFYTRDDRFAPPPPAPLPYGGESSSVTSTGVADNAYGNNVRDLPSLLSLTRHAPRRRHSPPPPPPQRTSATVSASALIPTSSVSQPSTPRNLHKFIVPTDYDRSHTTMDLLSGDGNCGGGGGGGYGAFMNTYNGSLNQKHSTSDELHELDSMLLNLSEDLRATLPPKQQPLPVVEQQPISSKQQQQQQQQKPKKSIISAFKRH